MKHLFKTRMEPFARGYLDCESDSEASRIVSGLLYEAREMYLSIDPVSGLPNASTHFCNHKIRPCGPVWEGMAVCYGYSFNIMTDEERLCQRIREEPEFAEDYQYILENMSGKSFEDITKRVFSETEKLLTASMAMWGGTWIGHSVPNFIDFAKYGTVAMRRKVEHYRAVNRGKDDFYDTEQCILDAIDLLGERFYALAKEQSAAEQDPEKRRRFERLVRTFSHAPQMPCTDFFEACAVLAMISSFDGVDSPGHFDQYMIDFWRASPEPERREALHDIWEFFHDFRIWNLCISGSWADGSDLTNELSYAILEEMIRTKYQTPNVTMRVHRGTPEPLLRLAADSIGTGTGLPALYNDDVVCSAYEAIGMPAEDAHRYVMNGCNQIDIQGKSHMGLEDGEVNFAKAMEYALSRGYDFLAGKTIAPDPGDPAAFSSFAEVYDAFCTELDYLTEAACAMANKSQKAAAEYCPSPLRTLTIEGCLERGIEYKSGGPLYGHGQILAEGMADAFDSLAAIKQFVFEEKQFSMSDLIDAIRADFDGYPEIYRTLKESPWRFGNDIEWVDELAAKITDRFMKKLKTLRTFRGGIYGGGCSPFNRAALNGCHTDALPSGKKRGESTFADGIGAVPGFDTHGPTAALRSAMHYNQREALSGFILNLKFDKSLFNTEKGKNGFLALVKTYFAGGGQELQINVLDAEELLDAKAHPENHKNLIVRVGGYSDYFNNLSPELQENVIARTGFRL